MIFYFWNLQSTFWGKGSSPQELRKLKIFIKCWNADPLGANKICPSVTNQYLILLDQTCMTVLKGTCTEMQGRVRAAALLNCCWSSWLSRCKDSCVCLLTLLCWSKLPPVLLQQVVGSLLWAISAVANSSFPLLCDIHTQRSRVIKEIISAQVLLLLLGWIDSSTRGLFKVIWTCFWFSF